MTAPSKPLVPEGTARPRRSLNAVIAFLLGLPLAAAFLYLVHFGPWQNTLLQRYFKHGVEWVEVVMFCCAASALGAKLWLHRNERRACRSEVLPLWDGQPVPVSEAAILFSVLNRLPRALQNTYLANRVAAVLDFLMRRGSAAELDDQLRDLADADNVALENSFALVRFITWAIPILGFLGTVLGITGAISGVTPERLENDLNSVTDGLALAFDATALALGLTMLTMFFTYVVDRLEQSVLENVDRYVVRHLAHRFERPETGDNQVRGVVQQAAQALLRTSEELVQRQAQVWAQTLAEVDRGRSQVEERLQTKMTAALETALERTLQAHGQRLALLEKQTLEQGKGLLGQVASLTTAMGRQQETLGQTAQGLAALATTMAQLQEGEQQLIRLQETLARNLEVLTGAGSFEQAVHTLTAAVHLLTARATATPIAGSVGPACKRPGVAA